MGILIMDKTLYSKNQYKGERHDYLQTKSST